MCDIKAIAHCTVARNSNLINGVSFMSASPREKRTRKTRIAIAAFVIVYSCRFAVTAKAQLEIQLLPDYNTTCLIGDVVHLGDSTGPQWLPSAPSGLTLALPFDLGFSASLVTSAVLRIDQYQANGNGEESIVTVNGQDLGQFRRNDFITDLSPGDPLPVRTDTFAMSPSILTDSGNVVTLHSNDEDNTSGFFDNFSVTNIRVTLQAECPVDGLTLPHEPSEAYALQDLSDGMQRAVTLFQGDLATTTGLNPKPSSGFRSQSLQNHFIDIADAFARLASVDGVSKSMKNGHAQLAVVPNSLADLFCGQEIATLNTELHERHQIVRNSDGDPAVDRNSLHPTRQAVDFDQADVDAMVTELGGAAQLEEFARMRGLNWFGYPRRDDYVHFQYTGLITNGKFNSGSLEGWSIEGDGSVAITENPNEPGDFLAQLTAGSPILLSQAIEVPVLPSVVKFDTQLLSENGSLEVLVDSISIGKIERGSFPNSALSEVVFQLPQNVLGEEVILEFVFDGPPGSSALLDNVSIDTVPEPSSMILGIAACVTVSCIRRFRRGLASLRDHL